MNRHDLPNISSGRGLRGLTRSVNASGPEHALSSDAYACAGSHAGVAVGDAITATDRCKDLRTELSHLSAFTALVRDAA